MHELPTLSASPGAVIESFESWGARVERIPLSQEGDVRRVELDVELPRERPAAALVAQVADVEDVAGVQWAD